MRILRLRFLFWLTASFINGAHAHRTGHSLSTGSSQQAETIAYYLRQIRWKKSRASMNWFAGECAKKRQMEVESRECEEVMSEV
jgi:hypothetical protein